MLSDDQVAEAHCAGATARSQFQETLGRLVDELCSIDALEVLARAASVLAMQWINGKLPVEGDLELFHLELLQAFALARPRGTSRPDVVYPDITQNVLDLIQLNGKAYRDQARSKTTTDIRVNRQQEVLRQVRDWTFAVRGARHAYQSRQYAEELAASLNASFRQCYGCDATEVVKALSLVVTISEDRLRAHLQHLRTWMLETTSAEMLFVYQKTAAPRVAARVSTEAAAWAHDLKATHAYLWDISEERLKDVYTFSLDDLAEAAPAKQRKALKHALRGIAMKFGVVSTETLEHVHLNNPIRLKPFIELDGDRLFCSCIPTVGTQIAEIFEDLCAASPGLKKTAEAARSHWLETRLSDIVRRFLPHAVVHDSVKWDDDGGQKTWECDVVAQLDKNVFVFEAKSAKISAPARRGAINSLKDALHDLVVDPSEQSLRLKQRLTAATGPVAFTSDQGSLTIDPADVRDVVRINILHDAVGPLSSHWPVLEEVGLIPASQDIAPSMTVFDLESVFEGLSLELERCHYLRRRGELERHAKYVADELDLLALYIREQFNIGEDEFNGKRHQWYGLSVTITPAFYSEESRRQLPFKIERTPFWSELLAALERNRPPGWTRFGHRLLNLNLDCQQQIEALMHDGIEAITRQPDRFFTTGLTYGSRSRSETISVNVGVRVPMWQFNENLTRAARSAFEQGARENILALYWYVPRTLNAYDFIGTLDLPW